MFAFLFLPSLYLIPKSLRVLPISHSACFPVCRSLLFKSDCGVTVARGPRGTDSWLYPSSTWKPAIKWPWKKLITVEFLCGPKWRLEGLWISYQVFDRAKEHEEMRTVSPRLICAWLISASGSSGRLRDAKCDSSERLINIECNYWDSHWATIWQCLHLLRGMYPESNPA